MASRLIIRRRHVLEGLDGCRYYTRLYCTTHSCALLPIRRREKKRLWTGDDDVPGRRIKFVNAGPSADGYCTVHRTIWCVSVMMFSHSSVRFVILLLRPPLWSPFSSIKTHTNRMNMVLFCSVWITPAGLHFIVESKWTNRKFCFSSEINIT